MRAGRRSLLLCAVLVLASSGSALAAASGAPVAGDGHLVARTVSTRADLVTGNDARIAVDLPSPDAQATVRVDGEDVTATLSRQGSSLGGVVRGLHLGRNEVVATLPDGRRATLVVTDHPVGGPLFAGPQVQPWACTTEANGLGPPVDAQCDAAAPVVTYQYKNAVTGQFEAYDRQSPPAAAQVATTTTDSGQTVPYVVRLQRGTLDRSVYEYAVLDAAWNGKLYVPFGGSCSAKHSQTAPAAVEVSQGAPDPVLVDHQLGRGWAVAATGLNTLAQNCNLVVAAEALTMVKELVGDELGAIRYTIGAGCSGGSMQVHNIADTYPGLLDGILPVCSFPDLWTPVTELADCMLLNTYMTSTSPALWADPDARAAVSGHQTTATCSAFVASFAGVLDPTNNSHPITGCDVPDSQIYDPATRRDGVRCTIQDYTVAVWGPRGPDGFAGRPLDNVGVQYGLAALESGRILPEQFVDLNEKIGGLDLDAQPTAARMTTDPQTVTTAYRADRITNGHNLASVPIIDLRGTGNAEIHTDYHSYSTRERLRRANGDAENQVIWTTATDDFLTVGRDLPGSVFTEAFDTLDTWVAAVTADTSSLPTAEKVRLDRPAAAVDACFIGGQKVVDKTVCSTAYPTFAGPRIAAGGPLANDVVKCVLQPLDRTDYDVAFTDAQWQRLQQAFPDGVCDWAASAAAARPAALTWPTFQAGPGGVALGPAPSSVASSVAVAAVSPVSAPVSASSGGATGGRSLAATGASTIAATLGVVLLLGAWLLRRTFRSA